MIDLRPLAPVFLAIACFAISTKASSLKSMSTLSRLNKYLYCSTSAFLGSLRILTSADSSSSWRLDMTGSLPTNSGIKPNLIRSSGSSLSTMSDFVALVSFTSAPKPIPDLSVLLLITSSIPAKAPPQMNKILEVSI